MSHPPTSHLDPELTTPRDNERATNDSGDNIVAGDKQHIGCAETPQVPQMSKLKLECASTTGLPSESLNNLLQVSDSTVSTTGSTAMVFTPSSSMEDVAKHIPRDTPSPSMEDIAKHIPRDTVVDMSVVVDPSMQVAEGQIHEGRLMVSERKEGESDVRTEPSDGQQQQQQQQQQRDVSPDISCCRICHEGASREGLVSPCYCTGTVGKIHLSCLETWLQITHRSKCELCSYDFPVDKIPPPMKTFFCNPTKNTEFPNLICDLICFAILVPLLVITTLLCSRGIFYYDSKGNMGTVLAIATLISALVAVFLSWTILAFRYHYRFWCIWRDSMSEIRMCREKLQRNAPCNQNMPAADDSTSSSSFSESVPSGGESRKLLKERSLLFKALFRHGGRAKVAHGAETIFGGRTTSSRQIHTNGDSEFVSPSDMSTNSSQGTSEALCMKNTNILNIKSMPV